MLPTRRRSVAVIVTPPLDETGHQFCFHSTSRLGRRRGSFGSSSESSCFVAVDEHAARLDPAAAAACSAADLSKSLPSSSGEAPWPHADRTRDLGGRSIRQGEGRGILNDDHHLGWHLEDIEPSDAGSRVFGRKSPGTAVRRSNDCLILEPSEMIVLPASAGTELSPSPSLSSTSSSQQRRLLGRGNSADQSASSKRSSRGGCSDDAASSVLSSSSLGDVTADQDLLGCAASGFNGSLLDSDEEDGYTESAVVLQDVVFDCLEKDPGDRSDDDIERLLEFMHNLPAFSNLTMATRRAMCAVMVYAVVDKAGTMVMNDGEELDSWSAILNGKVEITYADGSTKMLHVGESFGIRPTREKEYHRGVMKTVEDDCQFVCIAQSDYYRILHQGQENTTVLKENGEIVSITEKRVLDAGARAGSVVIRATPDCLIRHLVEDHSPVDTTYVEDFLLTYRTFLASPQGVAKKLLHWFRTDAQLRARVTRVILLWVTNHFNDFECDVEMTDFLQAYEQLLESEAMLAQLRMLHMACTTKARARTVTLTRAMRDEMLHFSIHGGSERASAVFVTQVERGSKAHEGGLKRGDQILQVNGLTFEGISHARALDLLRSTTHLSITVKSNLLGFSEMINTPEGGPRESSAMAIKAVGGGAGDPLLAGPLSSSLTDCGCNGYNGPNMLRPPSESGSSTPSGGAGTGVSSSAAAAAAAAASASTAANKRSKVGRGQTERISSKDRGSLAMSTSASAALTPESATTTSSSSGVVQQSNNKLMKALSKIMPKSNSSIGRMTGVHGSSSHQQSGGGGGASLTAQHRSNSDPNFNASMQRSSSSPDLVAAAAAGVPPAAATAGAFGVDDSQGPANFPEHVLKIYRADQSCKYFLVHKETNARDVVMLALRQFGISEHSSNLQNITCSNYCLCEVSAEANGVVKQKRLPDAACGLAERIGVRSRYYLKNNMCPETLVPDDAVHDMVKESQFAFLSLSCLEMAMQLAIADSALFQRIEPTEYIDDLCSIPSKFGTAQFQKFVELANREMFWVVTEVCSEPNVYKRVKILKHFIKIARYCKEFRNFNSMFAILSGLGQGAVSRLRSTWEKLPSKYQKMFEDLEGLMDPTRNMAKYRSLLVAAAASPPVIPFFPIVKKDLAFIHYGNDTTVEGLVNFEKMRMIAKEVRQTCGLASAQYTTDGMLGSVNPSGTVYHGFANTSSQANMSGFVTTRRKKRGVGGGGSHVIQPKKMFEEAQMMRRVKAYLAELQVEQDEDKLLDMSYKCEASRRNEMSSQSSSISVGGNSTASSTPSQAPSAAKFGSVSPERARKLASLSESTRPLHSGGGGRHRSHHHQQQSRPVSPVNIMPPVAAAASHSPSPSPLMTARCAANGLSPPPPPYGSGLFARPVDLSSESSSVVSMGNGSRKSSITGLSETSGERRRGVVSGSMMSLPLAPSSGLSALHDNDSGHCSFASSSYDAQSMSSASSANSPPPPHRQAMPGQASAYAHGAPAIGGGSGRSSQLPSSVAQQPSYIDGGAGGSRAAGVTAAAACTSSRYMPHNISNHERSRNLPLDRYRSDDDDEEVISAV